MPSPMFFNRFSGHARADPERIALVWQEERIGYGELYRMVSTARESLLARFESRRQLVCVPAVKSPETIALLIAAHAQGLATLVPSAELGRDALTDLARRSGSTHLLRAGRRAGQIEVTPVPGAHSTAESPRRGRRRTTSLVLTTSGSTGTPKAVPVPHRAIDRFAGWAEATFGIRPGTRVLSYAPLNFDLSLLDVWTTLAAGATVVLVDPARATDGAHLAELAASVDVLQGVPLVYRLITAHAREPLRPEERHLILTGDSADPALATRVTRVFPGAVLHNVYGCTETNDSFHHRIGPADLAAGVPFPIGRPLPGVRALVLGPDGALVEGPGSGELVVSTPFQTTGYLDPAHNTGRFLPAADLPAPPGGDAAAPDEGTVYYRTGDIVRRLADGTVFLEGRDDFHVKIRGVRTNLQEVERVLLDHPLVAEAAVVAVPDDLAGHLVHAAVRRADGSGLNSLDLRKHCMNRLPRTAIPGRFDITELPLPSTPTGKTDRKTIRAMATGETPHVHP